MTALIPGAGASRRAFLELAGLGVVAAAGALLAGQAPVTSGGAIGNTMPPTEAIKMAVVILTVAPIVAIYPFIQRHFIKGVLIGAVKG